MKEMKLKTDVSFGTLHELSSGKFTAIYESSRLRYIRYDGFEVLRMIYPALRSEEWETIEGIISGEKLTRSNDGFSIEYQMQFGKGPIKYQADFEIHASPERIEYVMKGKSLGDFKSKRIGLCVHHAIEACAGRTVTVEHPDRRAAYVFPVLISPVWPFTDIKSMHWNAYPVAIELKFEGDLFEMEDQRNWTDDSYKTYSGPQYKTPMLGLKKGDTMEHRVVLKVEPLKFRFPKIAGIDYQFIEVDLTDAQWEHRIAPREKETLIAVKDIDEQMYNSLKSRFPDIKVGLSKGGWFADVNAADLENSPSDFTHFIVSPQVHQNNPLSVLENLGSQHSTIETLRFRTNNKPAHITIRYEGSSGSHFETWWLLNSLYNLAGAGYIDIGELNLSAEVKNILAFRPAFISRTKTGDIVLENAEAELLTIKFES